MLEYRFKHIVFATTSAVLTSLTAIVASAPRWRVAAQAFRPMLIPRRFQMRDKSIPISQRNGGSGRTRFPPQTSHS